MFTRLFTVIVFGLLGFESFAKPATVDTASFTPGRQWSWVYSSLDKATGTWTPYFREIYTVVERQGSKATVTMRSGSLNTPVGEPHHKFTVDLADCERNQADSRAKFWTIAFYTKSFGNGWTVVNLHHKNDAFTEKFNCAPLNPSVVAGNFVWQGQARATIQFPPKGREDASFYFLDLPGAEGVTAEKLFQPNLDYKSEFESTEQTATGI